MQRVVFEDSMSARWRDEATRFIHMETLLRSVDTADGRVHMESLFGIIIKAVRNLDHTPAVALRVEHNRRLYVHLSGSDHVHGYGSPLVPLEIYKRPNSLVGVPVPMHRHCWLPPGRSPLYNACSMDVFCLIARYLSGWDILGLRVLCRRFADYGSRNAVWRPIVSRLRATMGPAAAAAAGGLFASMPSLHMQFVHLSLCFSYRHRGGRDPRTGYMAGEGSRGIRSILHVPEYKPLLAFAVAQINPQYVVRMTAPVQFVKTKRQKLSTSSINCMRYGAAAAKGRKARAIEFWATFAAGRVENGYMFPVVWVPANGTRLLTASANSRLGSKCTARIEPTFKPFLRKIEEM